MAIYGLGATFDGTDVSEEFVRQGAAWIDWSEPSAPFGRLCVSAQPEPMREWSPYAIHPVHLDHYLQSHQGEFLLEGLPDGRTRLVGTTWYSNRMWPAPQWSLRSDNIIHRIHGRVLTPIKKLAEVLEATKPGSG